MLRFAAHFIAIAAGICLPPPPRRRMRAPRSCADGRDVEAVFEYSDSFGGMPDVKGDGHFPLVTIYFTRRWLPSRLDDAEGTPPIPEAGLARIGLYYLRSHRMPPRNFWPILSRPTSRYDFGRHIHDGVAMIIARLDADYGDYNTIGSRPFSLLTCFIIAIERQLHASPPARYA